MPIIFHFSVFHNVGNRFIFQKQGTFIQMLTLTEQHENSVLWDKILLNIVN